MSGSDDRVRTARSLLLRAVESLGNGSTRSLKTNSENTSPQLQLANHDASGGRGVQREPAYESAAISTPTSKATTSAVAKRNRLFNFDTRGWFRGGSTPQTNKIVGPGTEPLLLRLWHRPSRFRSFGRRFRFATADVVALEVGVDIAADS